MLTDNQIELLKSEEYPLLDYIDLELLENVLKYYSEHNKFPAYQINEDTESTIIEGISKKIAFIIKELEEDIERKTQWNEEKERIKIKNDLLKYNIVDAKVIDSYYEQVKPDRKIMQEKEAIVTKFKDKEELLAQEFFSWFFEIDFDKIKKYDGQRKTDILSDNLLDIIIHFFDINNTNMSNKPFRDKLEEQNIRDHFAGKQITPVFYRFVITPLITQLEEEIEYAKQDYLKGFGFDKYWFQYSEDILIILEVLENNQFKIKVVTYGFCDQHPISSIPDLSLAVSFDYPFTIDTNMIPINSNLLDIQAVFGYDIREIHGIPNNSAYGAINNKKLYPRVVFDYVFDNISGVEVKLANFRLIEDEFLIIVDEEYKEWRRNTLDFFRKQVLADSLLPAISNPKWIGELKTAIEKVDLIKNELLDAKNVMEKYYVMKNNDLNIIVELIKSHKSLEREVLLVKFAEHRAKVLNRKCTTNFINSHRTRLNSQIDNIREYYPDLIRISEKRKSSKGGPNILVFEYLYDSDIE
ncbi:MAG: hypothetical protein INQ03_08310 [Candidatus Heimdallarchaeota archaeon]|nr:hypothetical protein [Candidatus Heimdallarchaeota archaeon]